MTPTPRGGFRSRLQPALIGLIASLRHWLTRSRFARRMRLLSIPRRLYRMFLARLVARTGLFDAHYYAERNPDVLAAGWDPLLHYVSCGDHEGRKPMPLFEPGHYREQLGGSVPLNALLHFSWVGRERGLSPTPWFDERYYRANNPDVAADADALLHYLQRGGLEGRSPCAAFNSRYYLATNADVAASRVNPLIHYIDAGYAENRRPLPPSEDEAAAAALPTEPLLPTEAEWDAATPRPDRPGVLVDVIVPVYKGRGETLRCIHSALAAPVATPFALIVIDDCGPEHELAQDLRRLAERGLFTLLVNEKNLGFVKTTNRGMRLHADRDVVLLNADAEVYNDWLDRLRAVCRRSPRIASVTPLSNNATICSYPRSFQDNPYPLEVGYAELDRLAAAGNAGLEVEAPTGNGFCIYLRRECLAEVGLFDEDAFGRGYGEENDLCQRALRRGWKSVITPEVFVRHRGSTSFEGERAPRVQAALKIVGKRYPEYERDVTRFATADPLMNPRRTLDVERLRRHVKARNVLIVCHGRGGGTERQVREELRQLAADGRGAFLVRPNAAIQGRIVVSHPAVRSTPNLAALELSDTARLADLCRRLEIAEVHVHSLVDFAPNASDDVVRLVDALGCRLEVRVHDYETICPRLTLSDENGIYCGEPDARGCNTCLRRRGSEFRVSGIQPWRALRERYVRRADRVVVPDEDVASRLQRYFPGLPIDVVPHEARQAPVPAPELPAAEPFRVVVVGAISRQKGYDILRACALAARKDRLPLKFVLMGYSLDDATLTASGVEVAGRYEDERAVSTLAGLSPHAVWLPSTWPETYSFTLSLALRSGYPVFAFDLGAIGRRLRALGCEARLIPLRSMSDPAAVNAFLLNHLRSGLHAA